MELTLQQLQKFEIGQNGISVLFEGDKYWISSIGEYGEITLKSNVARTITVGLKAFKLVARPMNLTKPIKVDGVEIIPYKEIERLFDVELESDLHYCVHAEDDGIHYFSVLKAESILEWLYKNKFAVGIDNSLFVELID